MSEDESLSTGDPQDDNDIIMDEFCMLERFEKLRDQTARNRTSIAELEMKLEDLFVKVKDKTSSRDSRAIARGAACMATWLEIAGRKQPPDARSLSEHRRRTRDAHLDVHCWIRVCTGRRTRCSALTLLAQIWAIGAGVRAAV